MSRKLNIANIGLKGIPVTLGGIDNFVENIATRMVQRGHSVSVYNRAYVTKIWLESISHQNLKEKKRVIYYKGIRIITLPTLQKKNLDAIFHTTLGAAHSIFQPYDILNYHTIGASLVSFLSWLRPSQKTICSVHGLDWARSKWNTIAQTLIKKGEYTSARFVDATHVVSNELKKYYDAKYNIKSVYIPTGVEIKRHVEPRLILKYGIKKEKYLLFLSRLVPEKGAHYLIQAFNELQTDMKLVIAGDVLFGEKYVEKLRQMAGKNIIFTGYVPDEEMDELFANAYIYILPSEIEGLPHSLLQGLSYGRCVVASDIPPNREALGNCGYTFKNGDIGSLRQILQKLIDNPSLVSAEYEKSIQRVKSEYDWERVADKFEELYYQTLGI